MSAGHEHSADCTEVLLRVYEFLDGEMGPDDCAKIQAHLDDCERCLRAYHLDRTLKALVRRSCAREEAPPQLRATILTRITTVHIERRGFDPDGGLRL